YGVMPVFSKASDLIEREPVQLASREDQFPLAKTKARLTIQKLGNLKYISHLDWLRMLHRAVSGAGLPMAYTQGFNPSPRISFGPALPVFVEGIEEYIDLEMTDEVPELMERLNRQLPRDGKILSCKWLAIQEPSVDKLLDHCIYSA